MKAMIITTIVTAIFFILCVIVLCVDAIDRKFFNSHWSEELEIIGLITVAVAAGGFWLSLLYLA